MLVEGTVAMRRWVEGTNVEVNRTDHRGVYAGATAAFVKAEAGHRYANTLVAVTDSTFWVIDAVLWADKIRVWFPMAIHMLEGLATGMRNSQLVVGQRERLLSLGRLAAGLTHELNNPASAAVRATASLRERVSKMRGKLSHLASADIDGREFAAMVDLQEAAVERMAKITRELSPMETSEAEDELGDWLDDHDVQGSWDVAPVLVAAGADVAWLDELAESLSPEILSDAVHWVAYALDTEQLMNEIEDATTRISTLVGAAKQYSQMDRATHADIDVHEGLKSTIMMLKHKITAPGNITAGQGAGRGPAAGPGLPGRAQPGLDEPDRQRGAGDARRRHADDPDEPGARRRARRDRRHGHRHPEGPAGADLRALLHHQAGGRGDRAGPRHLLPRDRPAPRRRPARAVRAGRHPLPGPPAAGDAGTAPHRLVGPTCGTVRPGGWTDRCPARAVRG